MDPITALGAASSVIQFIDFAARIVSKGNQIYHSGDGVLQEHHDVSVITSDLLLMKTSLEQFGAEAGSAQSDEATVSMSNLLDGAVVLAEQLLKRLNMVKSQGTSRRWKSFRQALKAICSKKEVDEMAGRLAMFKDQLQLRILVSIKGRLDSSSSQQATEYSNIEKMLYQSMRATDASQRSISEQLDKISQLVVDQNHDNKRDLAKTSSTILSSLDSAISLFKSSLQLEAKRTTRTVEDLYDALELPEQDERLQFYQKIILKSLADPGSDTRFEGIDPAHARTFAWIFKDDHAYGIQWHSFVSWLQHGSGIYWITGKPASGKSTLMKFIVQHHKTRKALRDWTGGSYEMASFFFWSLGTPMQKSHNGLLRSLLCQILSSQRDLIQSLLPELWKKVDQQPRRMLKNMHDSWHSWSVVQLQTVLEAVFSQTKSPLKICLFIDGLDEFDGDHAKMAQFCQHLASFPSVKICVSSRYLISFEEAFSECSQLHLQDLTREDIKLYVSDKLGSHKRMHSLLRTSSEEVSTFIDSVVEMSSGVFLWIVLVTASLLKGLTNRDSMSDLRKRLSDLPSELDQLYSLILQSINPPFYREQASRLFQIVYHTRMPLTTLQLSFADDVDAGPPFGSWPSSTSQEEISQRAVEMKYRLRSRCSGLLESNESSFNDRLFEGSQYLPAVRFLHLTVREFLEKPEVWNLLLSYTSESSFDPHVSLLWSRIMTLKTVNWTFCLTGTSEVKGENNGLHPILREAVYHAVQAEESTAMAQIRLVDEIAILGRTSFRKLNNLPWTLKSERGFMEYAVRKGLTLYVKAKLQFRQTQLMMESANGSFWLYTALQDYLSPERASHSLSLSMVGLVLEMGASPNKSPWENGSVSVWIHYLRSLLNDLRNSSLSFRQFRKKFKTHIDICKLMLIHGAGDALHEVSNDRAEFELLLSLLDHSSADELRNCRDSWNGKIGQYKQRKTSSAAYRFPESRSATTCFSESKVPNNRSDTLFDSYRPNYANEHYAYQEPLGSPNPPGLQSIHGSALDASFPLERDQMMSRQWDRPRHGPPETTAWHDSYPEQSESNTSRKRFPDFSPDFDSRPDSKRRHIGQSDGRRT